MESISRRVARQNASCSSSLLAPERDWSAYRGSVGVNDLVELNLVVQSLKAEEETEDEPDPRVARLLEAGRAAGPGRGGDLPVHSRVRFGQWGDASLRAASNTALPRNGDHSTTPPTSAAR
jgi:hypothetical protein